MQSLQSRQRAFARDIILSRPKSAFSFSTSPSHITSSGRYQRRHTNILKDPFRGKPISIYTPKDIVRELEREVDQIAPKAAAHSIDSLQRWALHTADLPHGPPRRNEFDTVEWVHDHYVNEDISYGVHKEIDLDASAAPSVQAVLDTVSNEHFISPTGSLQLDTLYSKASATDALPTTPLVADSTEVSTSNNDNDSAPSSERTSSSEDKAATAHAFPNQGAIYLYEKLNAEGFKLIGSFATVKRAALILGLSSSELKDEKFGDGLQGQI